MSAGSFAQGHMYNQAMQPMWYGPCATPRCAASEKQSSTSRLPSWWPTRKVETEAEAEVVKAEAKAKAAKSEEVKTIEIDTTEEGLDGESVDPMSSAQMRAARRRQRQRERKKEGKALAKMESAQSDISDASTMWDAREMTPVSQISGFSSSTWSAAGSDSPTRKQSWSDMSAELNEECLADLLPLPISQSTSANAGQASVEKEVDALKNPPVFNTFIHFQLPCPERRRPRSHSV